MKSKSLKISLVAIAIFMVASCKREDKFEGPDLNDIYGSFAVLEEFKSDRATVDFSTGATVQFTARFTAVSDWKLTIKSNSNGATKIFIGRSKELNAINATWDGSITSFPTFSTGMVTAELFLASDSSKREILINVTGAKKSSGKVIEDFENGLGSSWTLFKQSGLNMSFITRDTGDIAQGNKYYDMAGQVNWDWLIGYVDFTSKGFNATSGFNLSNNANVEYFNVLLNRPKGITNGVVLFQFKEDDNGDGSFNAANEDMYAIEIRGLKEGWQIVSVKYADLISLVNGAPAAPKGNGANEPNKLHTISCLFLADPSSGYSRVLMDYLVFTQNAPLAL